MIFIKFSCTENWSIQSLKKTSHWFKLYHILHSDCIDWVYTTLMGDGRGRGSDEGKVEGKMHHCTSIQARTLLTRVVAGLDESMSARLVSMERQSRWSKPTRSRRWCRRRLVVAAGFYIVTSLPVCRRKQLLILDILIDMHRSLPYLCYWWIRKLFQLPKQQILMTSSHCYIIYYVMVTNE